MFHTYFLRFFPSVVWTLFCALRWQSSCWGIRRTCGIVVRWTKRWRSSGREARRWSCGKWASLNATPSSSLSPSWPAALHSLRANLPSLCRGAKARAPRPTTCETPVNTTPPLNSRTAYTWYGINHQDILDKSLGYQHDFSCYCVHLTVVHTFIHLIWTRLNILGSITFVGF